MTANEEYRALYECNFDAARDALKRAKEEAQAEWETKVASERKRCGTKKREDLPTEFYDSLRATLYARYNIESLSRGYDEHRDTRDEGLDRLAKGVAFSPDPSAFRVAKTSSIWGYSTQTASESYARGSLAPLDHKLQSLGFSTHVLLGFDGVSGLHYQLWVNAPEWMIDAAKRLTTIEDAIIAYNRAGVNARVCMPFLSHDVDIYGKEYRQGA
jgi:hypothetical protein